MKSVEEKLKEATNIIQEVRSLRTMQKEYFKYRDISILQKCKIQENKIDLMIEAFNH